MELSGLEFVLILTSLLIIFIYYRHKLEQRRIKYIDSYIFPIDIAITLKRGYPQLSNENIELVLDGLRAYLKLYVTANRRTIIMPSIIIDKVWYQFMIKEEEYETFCIKAFGHYLNKTQVKSMEDKNTASRDIQIVWQLACHDENIDAAEPNELPIIFSLDSLLNIPDGFKYEIECTDNDLSFCAKSIGAIGIDNTRGGRTINTK